MTTILRSTLLLPLVLGSGIAWSQEPGAAAPRSLLQLLPEDAVVTARASGLRPLVEAVWPRWSWSLQDWPALQERFDRKGRAELAKGEAFLRAFLGPRDQELILDLLAGEMVAAVVPGAGKPGVLVLARTRFADELADTVRRFARMAKAPVHDDLHGLDVAAELNGGAGIAARDGVLMLGSDQELVRSAAARWEQGGFLGRTPRSSAAPLKVWVDLARARALAQGKGPFAEQALDVGGLLFGLPALAVLRAAPALEAELRLAPGGVTLTVTAPGALAGLEGARRDLLLADSFRADLVPELPGEVAALSLSPSLPVLVARRKALLREGDQAGAEQAVSIFTLLFSGHKLEEQVLPALAAGFHVVLNREQWDQVRPLPPVRFPTAALVLGLRDPHLERAFHSAFENAMRFGEGDRKREGKLLFALERDTAGDVLLTTARPRVPADRTDLPVDAGLTPTLAASQGRVLLASSETLAAALAQAPAAAATSPAAGAGQVLGRLRLSGPGVALAMEDGNEALVAQRMLETGRARAEIEQELATLRSLVLGVHAVAAELLATAGGGLCFRAEVRMAEAAR